MTSENSKRIAKNTILLYFRMLSLLLVSLYTSRIVLEVLGVEDFGIYSVVGGIVIMFSFINSSMSSATQRFISFELGLKNFLKLRDLFSMSVNIHLFIAAIIFVLAETIGLWFLNTHLVIPQDRIEAANWVYQFSILSFMVTIMSVPYNALIIAHERMNVYAYVGIIEVVLKLGIVFSLSWYGLDKLKLYAILIFGVSAFIWLIYRIYCGKYFVETKYRFFWDNTLFKILLNYSGWNLFGNIAVVSMGQGVNILLNVFFNPIVNAARAIAYQVNGAVNGFVSNFQIAMNPQVIKSFAINDFKYMHELIFKGSKYSFFLLYIISLPILLETEMILKFWLNNVPSYTALFCRLIIINALIDSISGPLMTAAQASGEIKKYQITIGILLLMNLPISYLLLKIGMPPQSTMYTSIAISLVALVFRLIILKPLIYLSISKFLSKVVFYIVLVAICSIIIPGILKYYLDPGFLRFLFVSASSFFFSLLFIYFIGLSQFEQKTLSSKIIYLLNRN